MNTKSGCADSLSRSGLKRTRQRTAILNILRESEHPISAEELYFELKKGETAPNLSTIYRTLETMANKGLIVKVSLSGDSRTFFEYNRMIHKHYLVCLGCKKITAIEGCPLNAYEKSLEQKTQYTIAGHKLDIYGYCPDCQSKRDCHEED